MMKKLPIALLCCAATAGADPLDVHVSVDVHVDAPPPVTAVPRTPQSDPPHRYFSVTSADGPNGMGGYRVQVDLRQGGGVQLHAGTLYTMFGAALASTTATMLNIASDDELAVRDQSAVGYAAMGARIGRLDARWYAGAGMERTIGTQMSYMTQTRRNVIDPVGEIGGDMYLRIAGPIALVGGGRVVIHAEKYRALDDASASFWREPGFQVFGGVAAITD